MVDLKKYSKFGFYLVTISLAFFLFKQPLFAQVANNSDSFETKLQTTITVQADGQTRVKHEFEITNKTPTTYISQYALKISSSQLSNFSVISSGQVLEPEVVTIPTKDRSGPGQTSIGLTFPDKVVGEGKTRLFSISYNHPDAAIVSGSVLEVSLPPQARPQDYKKYEVTLITPAKFGGPVRTTPKNHSFTASGNQIVTSFTQNGAGGIFALFGQEQLFELELNYHLDNPSNNPGITQIALPPDTSYQKMFYQDLEPRPEKIEKDPDGNWIATYQVQAGHKTLVTLKALAKLSLESNPEIPATKPGEELLSAREYWPVNQQKIQEIVQEKNTAETINNYVVETLSYNTQRALNNPERLGASTSLAQPDQAVCQEYTDLFITLARAAKIPARRMTGYAQTQNNELRPLSLVEDVLHAWPEYYNREEERWIPIDPTWEDTTGGVDYFNQLDLNHLVFAINGHQSSTPHPAGSYKSLDEPEKTVNVSFADSFPLDSIQSSAQTTPIQLELEPKKVAGLKIPGFYNLKLTNPHGYALYQFDFKFKANKSQLFRSSLPNKIEALLPFQTQKFSLWLESDSSWRPQKDTIQISLNHVQQEFNITNSPKLSPLLNQSKLNLALGGGLILLTLFGGSLLVFRKRR